jgi:hypothetical protein
MTKPAGALAGIKNKRADNDLSAPLRIFINIYCIVIIVAGKMLAEIFAF